MTDSIETLETAIPPTDFSNVVDAVKSALNEGEPGVRLAGMELDAGTLHKSVATAVEEALSISLIDTLLKAWEGMKSVQALVGEKGPMDGKTRVAALLKHKLKSTHTPEVRLTVGEAVDLRKIRIPVGLTVEVAGVSLSIKDRQIIGIAAGHLQPSVKIKVEKVTVVETKLRRIDLSDTVVLKRADPNTAPPPTDEVAQQV
ncbi:hypothetical protein [Aliiroseovarius sp. F47248L]|uniref:hypothetical protein n=1 Tax=Aliiroseovarius sp. F47248L TaxID=2926420 RepID=UPI001FF22C9B|nr:hypothetical protein [Aliiroseovarius sp. F47248L]MCK0139122.1 hypothetical protein [Aliiroseovarius sp. F47248L]